MAELGTFEAWQVILGVVAVAIAFGGLVFMGLTYLRTQPDSALQKDLVHIENYKDMVRENEALKTQLKEAGTKLVVGLEEEAAIHNPKAEKALQALADNDAEKAQELYKEIWQDGSKFKNQVDTKLAQVALNLGRAYLVDLKFHKALEAFEDAYRLAPSEWEVVNELEQIYLALGEYNKAQEILKVFLPKLIEQKGETSAEVAIAYNNLGGAWKAKGKYDKGIEYYNKALAIDLKNFGDDHPQIAIYSNNLGGAWKAKGEYDKAIEFYKKALAIDLNNFGDDHPKIAIRYNNLGTAWGKKGEQDKAIGYYEKALPILLKNLGNEHPHVAGSYNNLGAAWGKKENTTKPLGIIKKPSQYP